MGKLRLVESNFIHILHIKVLHFTCCQAYRCVGYYFVIICASFSHLTVGDVSQCSMQGEKITSAEMRSWETIESDLENFDLARFLQNQLNKFENCQVHILA